MRMNYPTHSFNRQSHLKMKLSEHTRSASRAPEVQVEGGCSNFQSELLGVGHGKPQCCLLPPCFPPSSHSLLNATPPHPAMQPRMCEKQVRSTTESGTRETDLLPPPQPLGAFCPRPLERAVISMADRRQKKVPPDKHYHFANH